MGLEMFHWCNHNRKVEKWKEKNTHLDTAISDYSVSANQIFNIRDIIYYQNNHCYVYEMCHCPQFANLYKMNRFSLTNLGDAIRFAAQKNIKIFKKKWNKSVSIECLNCNLRYIYECDYFHMQNEFQSAFSDYQPIKLILPHSEWNFASMRARECPPMLLLFFFNSIAYGQVWVARNHLQ